MPTYKFLVKDCRQRKPIVFESEGGRKSFKLDNLEQAKGFAKALGIYEHYVPVVQTRKKKLSFK